MTARERLTKAQREQWEATVQAVLDNEDADVAPYKRKSILWARSEGCSADTITNLGQRTVLANYQKFKKNGGASERKKWLKFLVPCSLADAVMSEATSPDQEEALVTRLHRVCGIRKANELWEFLLSVFADLSDDDLRNLSGEGDVEKRY